jgi:hypothetical protein
MKNVLDERYIVSVVTASLNRKGRPSLMTRLRLRNAIKLGHRLMRHNVLFHYAIVPSCADAALHAEVTQLLVREIWRRHPTYEAEVITPERGEVLPLKADRMAFVTELAKVRGARFVVC